MSASRSLPRRSGAARSARRLAVGLTVALTAVTTAGLGQVSAVADTAPPATTPPTPATAAAVGLPTWQINGVAWSQVVVGNTVYVTGNFTTARPPGVAAGGAGEVPVGNLLAYDIRTGARIASFDHTLNAQGLVVRASADGKRLYVGGDFTTVDGKSRGHIAAFDLTTGKLEADFQPSIGGPVRAIALTADTVYVGGSFEGAQGVRRKRLAAFNVADGEMRPWAPSADDGYVWSMLVPPGGGKVIVGGAFKKVSGQAASGTAALDLTSGAVLPWAMNKKIYMGSDSAITNLSTDGTSVFGGGYAFAQNANLEGTFSANPSDGSLRWVADCLGDTYDTKPLGGALYVASHAHDCSVIGGHPDAYINGASARWAHAMALTTDPRGRNLKKDAYNFDFTDQAAPAELHWAPQLGIGQATGQFQAAWTVDGNDDYVVMSGEFPTVNGAPQQGLTRFARGAVITKTAAPQFQTQPARTLTAPVATGAGGVVNVKFQSAWDMDNATLTYALVRDRGTAAEEVVDTLSAASNYWTLPDRSLRDVAPPAGEHRYSIKVTDPTGQAAWSEPSNAASTTASLGAYSTAVLRDGADHYWRLGEGSGNAVDLAGGLDGSVFGGVSRNVAGALAGDTDKAMTVNGNGDGSGRITTGSTGAGEATSLEVWLKTTTKSGGRLFTYSSPSGSNTLPERHIYMGDDGTIGFQLNPSTPTVGTPRAYNTGQWVHVVATVGASGMKLYADGELVASKPTPTAAPTANGTWSLGADRRVERGISSSWAWQGSLDEAATYPKELTAAQVAAHAKLGRGQALNVVPKAAFAATPTGLDVALDASGSSDSDGTIASYAWDFGDGTPAGQGATATHTYAAAGDYTVKLTVTDNAGATATTTKTVTLTKPVTPVDPPVEPVQTFLAEDAFSRTVTDGWGSADVGGRWSLSGTASQFAVAGGAGTIAVAPGTGPAVMLRGISGTDNEVATSFSGDAAVTGGGLFTTVIARGDVSNGYGARVVTTANGAMRLYATRNVAGVGTDTDSADTGLTYEPGATYLMKVSVTGTAPTRIAAKIWKFGTPEPAAWAVESSDTTAELQKAGGAGLAGYLSKSATLPIRLSLSAFTVRTVQP